MYKKTLVFFMTMHMLIIVQHVLNFDAIKASWKSDNNDFTAHADATNDLSTPCHEQRAATDSYI